MKALFEELGVSGLLDILLMTLLIYALLVWLRRTRRSAAIIGGILIVGGIYLGARQFDLHLTAAVLQAFFAVILVAVIVIFQEDLRNLFEQVARWGLSRRIPLLGRRHPTLPGRKSDILVKTVTDMASEKTGALIVIRGSDALERHLEGGVELGGEVSEAVVKSIFDHHSIGHDGALVIEKDRISRFGCHLPLSKSLNKLQSGGTRHAAGLGLSEVCDALCIVVSEERGVVTIMRHGVVKQLAEPAELVTVLEEFYEEIAPKTKPRPVRDFFRRNSLEKLLALLLAAALWFVLVHESQTEYRSFDVSLEKIDLPDGRKVAEYNPDRIRVTLSGPRRAFYFVTVSQIRVALRMGGMRSGDQEVVITAADLEFPSELRFEHSEPRRIQLRISGPP